jgi:pimeloyl-ACP methyl ester carboxylesterase
VDRSPAHDTKWFLDAVGQRATARRIEVEGARISWRSWGSPEDPGVVLVHGIAAHTHWWDHIAPLLKGHRVAALDLSGHGNSDRRAAGYELETWAKEVLAVAQAEGMVRPAIVGHSLGGRVGLTASVLEPERFAAVAVVDTPLSYGAAQPITMSPQLRTYATRDQAVARFRTLPEQSAVLPYVRDHVAHHSVRRTPEGWTWAFDPRVFTPRPSLHDVLAQVSVPAALLWCESGLVGADMAAEMDALVADGMVTLSLPAAGHHPMLDHPLALVVGLRAILDEWRRLGKYASAGDR